MVAEGTKPGSEPIGVENMRGWLLADGLVMLKYTSENHGRRAHRTPRPGGYGLAAAAIR